MASKKEKQEIDKEDILSFFELMQTRVSKLEELIESFKKLIEEHDLKV